jgi:hypothetical protein
MIRSGPLLVRFDLSNTCLVPNGSHWFLRLRNHFTLQGNNLTCWFPWFPSFFIIRRIFKKNVDMKTVSTIGFLGNHGNHLGVFHG